MKNEIRELEAKFRAGRRLYVTVRWSIMTKIRTGGVKSVLLNYGQTQVPFFVRQSRFKRYVGACPAILVRQRRK